MKVIVVTLQYFIVWKLYIRAVVYFYDINKIE